MRSILLASILIALVAVSAPGIFARFVPEIREGAQDSGTEGALIAETPRETETDAAAGRQVEIEAALDGHFYVEAEVNFRPIRMMVDTGATVVALRQSDAAAVGIRVFAADFRHPVQTANGTTNAAEAELQSVALKGIEIGRVRALVIPDEQLAVSLLGGSFLGRLARFEVRSGTLIFEN